MSFCQQKSCEQIEDVGLYIFSCTKAIIKIHKSLTLQGNQERGSLQTDIAN